MESEINWTDEADKLKEKTDFLKMEEGRHILKMMDNGVKIHRDFADGQKERVQFAVMHKGLPKLWEINVSSADNSLFGQLAILGKKHSGLKNLDIEILVSGKGKEKRYTLPEAIDCKAGVDA